MGTSVEALVLAIVVIAGMLARPWRSHEWQWAIGGAAAFVLLRFETPAAAWAAIAGGWNVYAFLAGIAVLAEIARAEGVFEALALRARTAAKGSRKRLFFLVYLAGVAVTALLSNDTTALVLTPAVFAALEATGVEPLPYLYACAFVANAASFLLPFSNPANLVTFGNRLPPLGAWIVAFGLAAIACTVLTYLALTWIFAARLRKPMGTPPPAAPLAARTRLAALALVAAGLGMVAAAAFGLNMGLAALALAAGVTAIVTFTDRAAPAQVAAHLPWQILPLVGGLFVVVDALDRAGLLDLGRRLLAAAGAMPAISSRLAATVVAAIASNAVNNLPIAMAAAAAQGSLPIDHVLRAAAIGIDAGPNVCATGSLSTLLWLIAVRRQGVEISARSFFSIGARVGLPALLVAGLLVR